MTKPFSLSALRLVAALPMLMPLPGCQNLNRSLIFSTGTTVGLEVSSTPASGTPIQFVFGMKRAEILIDPVLSGKDSDVVEPRAHSVVAKLAGRIDPSAGGPGLSGSQWFASGRAAELLAEQPATAAVLTDSPTIARDIARAATRTFGPLPSDEAAAIQTELLLRYLEIDRTDRQAHQQFDDAAQIGGFANFASFVIANPTVDQAIEVRNALANLKSGVEQ